MNRILPNTSFSVTARAALAFLFICVIGSTISANAQTARQEAVGQLAVSTAGGPRIVTDKTEAAILMRTVSPSGNVVASIADATPIERRAFEMINSIRVKNGLRSLTWDPELCGVARAHSRNMARANFFSHVNPEGSTPKDRVQQAGLKAFRVIGENIAYNQGYDDPGAFAVERWMISPGHRDNILSKEFEASAIGVFVNSDGSVYLTELFITR